MSPGTATLFLTQPTEMHTQLRAAFDAGWHAGHADFRVVVHIASHDKFADRPMFELTLNPLPGSARKIVTLAPKSRLSSPLPSRRRAA